VGVMTVLKRVGRILPGIAIVIGVTTSLSAEEKGITVLSNTWYWGAAAYRANEKDSPDVCILQSGVQTNGLILAFRVDMKPTDPSISREFRVINDKWELAPNLDGSKYQVSIGFWNATLTVTLNDNHVIGTHLDLPTLQAMLNAMDNASVAKVTVGNQRTLLVSLNQSHIPTNAFRACAHISGKAPAGKNPFE